MRALTGLRSAAYSRVPGHHGDSILRSGRWPGRGCRRCSALDGDRLARIAIWGARWICGIRWHVEGWQNLPDGPRDPCCASTSRPGDPVGWRRRCRRLSFVYKRELHRVPFFGWGSQPFGMINIDRTRGKAPSTGCSSRGTGVRDGLVDRVFPEGTRTPPGSTAATRPEARAWRCAPALRWADRPLTRASFGRAILPEAAGEITVSIGAPMQSAAQRPRGRSPGRNHGSNGDAALAPHRYTAPYVPNSANAPDSEQGLMAAARARRHWH